LKNFPSLYKAGSAFAAIREEPLPLPHSSGYKGYFAKFYPSEHQCNPTQRTSEIKVIVFVSVGKGRLFHNSEEVKKAVHEWLQM
jgi:hypothetical protein